MSLQTNRALGVRKQWGNVDLVAVLILQALICFAALSRRPILQRASGQHVAFLMGLRVAHLPHVAKQRRRMPPANSSDPRRSLPRTRNGRPAVPSLNLTCAPSGCNHRVSSVLQRAIPLAGRRAPQVVASYFCDHCLPRKASSPAPSRASVTPPPRHAFMRSSKAN